MKRLVFGFLFIFCLVIVSYSQARPLVSVTSKNGKTPCRKNEKLVDADLPMVFLSFVRRETVKDEEQGEGSDRLFFKLTNNFCLPIWLDTSGAPKGWGEASLYYAIEDKGSGRRVSGTLHCHHCSNNQLGPGKSITFSIPFRDADRGAVMRAAFEFEFDRFGGYESSDTLHTVAYYFSGLPESVLPKLTFQ